MSRFANKPIRILGPTTHFSIIAFGLHEWLQNRARLPFSVASMNSSFCSIMK